MSYILVVMVDANDPTLLLLLLSIGTSEIWNDIYLMPRPMIQMTSSINIISVCYYLELCSVITSYSRIQCLLTKVQ